MDLTVTTVSNDDDRSVLRCAGAIDIESRSVLSDAAGPLVGNREIVLDMTGVSFMDSTGIGALVALSQSLEDAGGRLVISAASRPVARVLEVSGLADLWAP